jgi:hypothetical protein
MDFAGPGLRGLCKYGLHPLIPLLTWRREQNPASDRSWFYYFIKKTTDKFQNNTFTHDNTPAWETFKFRKILIVFYIHLWMKCVAVHA